mgnify:CR=1 FL=1
MENKKGWMKTQVIELLESATDEELDNVWHFVTHRIAPKGKRTEAIQA